jgi:hypothetical protein
MDISETKPSIFLRLSKCFPFDPVHFVLFVLAAPLVPTDHITNLLAHILRDMKTAHGKSRDGLGNNFDENFFTCSQQQFLLPPSYSLPNSILQISKYRAFRFAHMNRQKFPASASPLLS